MKKRFNLLLVFTLFVSLNSTLQAISLTKVSCTSTSVTMSCSGHNACIGTSDYQVLKWYIGETLVLQEVVSNRDFSSTHTFPLKGYGTIKVVCDYYYKVFFLPAVYSYTETASYTYSYPHTSLSMPGISSEWNQSRGSICLHPDFYKFHDDGVVYDDMWVSDMLVEYSVEDGPSKTLCNIKSNKQTDKYGKAYRSYSFEPRNGNQFQIRNRTTSTDTWEFVSANTVEVNDFSNNGNFTGLIHWQIPTELVGKKITFKYSALGNIGYNLQYYTASPSHCTDRSRWFYFYNMYDRPLSVAYTTPPTITTTSSWQKNGDLKYTVSQNGIPEESKYSILLNGEEMDLDNNFTTTENYFTYSNSELDTVKRYVTKASYSPNPDFENTPTYNLESNEVLVNAFALPEKLNVCYDGCAQQNSIQFSVRTIADSMMCTRSDFELIRAEDTAFTIGVKVLEDIPFDPNQTEYEYTDPEDLGINELQTYYYKLRRKQPGVDWGWTTHTRMGMVDYNTTHVQIKTITVSPVTGTTNFKVNWDYTNEGIWCDGSSKITLYRDGGGSGSIKLTDIAQREITSYVDDSPMATCTPYIYRIEIGSSKHGTTIVGSNTAMLPLDKADEPVLKYFKSSKGYYDDRVELEWSVKKGTLSSFLVKRKLYEELGDKYVTVADVATTSSKLYKYMDNQAVPSVYYSYKIVAVSDCNGIPSETELKSDIGFRMPTASVAGRVVYTGDVPVEGCNIIIQGADQMKNKALTLGNGIVMIPDTNKLILTSGFSIQAWLSLESDNNGIIFDKADRFQLLQNGTTLQIKVGSVSKNISYEIQDKKYFHLTIVERSEISYEVYVNSLLIDTVEGFMASVNNADTLSIGSGIVGFIDELRIWNKELSSFDIASNYDRYLSGKEKGLIAYYRLDDGVAKCVFDMSASGSVFNENHGEIIGDCPRTVMDIPSGAQLSLKGNTDANGNYLVSGIPYFSDGTSYTFTPQLGTHEFNPKQKPLFLSDKSAIQNNINFTDVSSFKYEGVVTYVGGNYPVVGVSFYIDGRQAIDGNGSPILSDNDGKYKLKVPIGKHTIEARKYGHTFVRDTSLNFQRDQLVGCNFLDATKIKLIGRVVGGNVEANKGLLVGESMNNIGKATIELTPVKSQYSISTVQNVADTVFHDDGTLTRPTSAQNSYTIGIKNISIETSHETGEFIAYVYPENYNLKISIGSEELRSSSIDLTNKIHKRYEVSTWIDSLFVPATSTHGAYKIAVEHVDSIAYYDKLIMTYVVDPEFSIIEQDTLETGGYKLKRFNGDSIFVYSPPTSNTKDTITLATIVNGAPKYSFEIPVYNQGVKYYYAIEAYEKYVNVDNQKIDKVPVSNCKIIIDNTMKVGSANIPETIEIDSAGQAVYTFVAGVPDLTTGLKKFDAHLERSGRTFLWANDFETYLLGSKSTGTNFTTTGPNKIIAVLRDPPGSNSYEYLEKGSTFSSSGSIFAKTFTESTVKATIECKPKVVVWAGVGGGTIVEQESGVNVMVGLHSSTSREVALSFNNSITTGKRYQTSSDPLWVGAQADLFIGNSTNILYGATNSITIAKSDLLEDIYIKLGDYAIGKGKGMALGQTFGTEFTYTQRDLEDIFMPAWETLRNSMLLPKGTVVDANVITSPAYVSRVYKDDPKYGSNNSNKDVWANMASNILGDGPSYDIVLPTAYANENWQDSVMWCNNQITYWKAVLAENEKQKLEAKLIGNKSFTSGAQVEYSKTITSGGSLDAQIDFAVGLLLGTDAGFEVSGIGVQLDVEAEIGLGGGYTASASHEFSKTIGFVLEESGDFDAISVDYKNTEDGSISFNTRAGQTSCPYEGATLTKYYQPGTILSEATMKMEVPKLSVKNSMVNQIPASRQGVFNIEMKNESEVDADTWFLLMVDGYTNSDGAIIAIDGQQINEEGRAYLVRAGQVLKKTLTLSKGPSAMDYKDIRLVLASTCQYDATDATEVLADTAYISASFIPNCSDIRLIQPENNWVMNTLTGDSIFVKINGYDVNFANFGYVMLQSKTASAASWKEEMKFYASQEAYDNAEGSKMLLDPIKDRDIQYWLNVPTTDNKYDIRAVAYCIDEVNGQVLAETPTDIASGVKDMVRPVLFGSAQPADGVLNAGDEIQIQFNEPIAEGLVTSNNISVVGIKNGVSTLHTSSVHFDGVSNIMTVESQINLIDKSFTFEVWLKRNDLGKGVILSQGEANGFEFGFTNDNKLYVKNSDVTIESENTYSELDIWNHYAVVYDNDSKKISVYLNGDFSISDASFKACSETGVLKVGSNAAKTVFISGDMHEMRMWEGALLRADISASKSVSLRGSEKGLIGYWPMNEGKGTVVKDYSRGRSGLLNAGWSLQPSGKSVSLSGQESLVELETSKLPIKVSSDYSIEFWFKGEAQKNACLFSAGRGDGQEWDGSLNKAALWFNEDGLLTFSSNGTTKVLSTHDYLNNNWHHIAISVNRVASVNFYIDGQLVADMNARDFSAIAASQMYLGARKYMDETSFNNFVTDMPFKGQLDEFRIWNLNLTEKVILSNMNSRLQGSEIGLVCYYPFDEFSNKQLEFSLNDQVSESGEKATLINGLASNDYAPIKVGNVPEKLGFVFATNNDKINIQLTESNATIERSLVTVTVSDIQDLNGNILSSPIKWGAYIDQSQLKWDEDQWNIKKSVNEAYSFTARIYNSGGTTQEFTLTDMPDWLEVDVLAGSIAAKSEMELTFMVDRSLNIGSYNEVIYLKSEYNQPLDINVLVMAEVPDWEVNPSEYGSSMNMIASVNINDILSTDKRDKVAVFVEGVCVGVAQPAYYEAYDKFFTFIKIYGNSSSQNKKLAFRVFDASSGEILSAKSETDIYYTDNKVLGSLSNPIALLTQDEICQRILLNSGWNWISFNVASSDLANVNSALSGMQASSGDVIKDNGQGLFDVYSSNMSSWTGTLSNSGGFNNASLYLLHTNSQMLSVYGKQVDPSAVSLSVQGSKWNYLSYLSSLNLNIKEALAAYEANENDVMKSQDAFSIYDPILGWTGDLDYLEPNKGYMLYRQGNSNVEFTYPQSMAQTKSLHIQHESSTRNMNSGKYSETMGVIAKVQCDIGIKPSDWILGYNNGELVSASQMSNVVYNGSKLLFANVEVNAKGDIHFVLERDGKEIREAVEAVPLAPNKVVGSLAQPQLLSFNGKPVSPNVVVYPNPMKDVLYVRIKAFEDQKAQVCLVDMLGQLVLESTTIFSVNNTFKASFNIGHLKSGVYLLSVQMDEQYYVYKLIKE